MSYVICITGQRYTDKLYEHISELSNKCNEVEFIFGDCTIVDTYALNICKELGLKYKVFKADWKNYGKIAGPLRNKEMIDYLLSKKNSSTVEVWSYHTDLNNSKGTIRYAEKANIVVKKFEL